jgi:hypothetical protein
VTCIARSTGIDRITRCGTTVWSQQYLPQQIRCLGGNCEWKYSSLCTCAQGERRQSCSTAGFEIAGSNEHAAPTHHARVCRVGTTKPPSRGLLYVSKSREPSVTAGRCADDKWHLPAGGPHAPAAPITVGMANGCGACAVGGGPVRYSIGASPSSAKRYGRGKGAGVRWWSKVRENEHGFNGPRDHHPREYHGQPTRHCS